MESTVRTVRALLDLVSIYDPNLVDFTRDLLRRGYPAELAQLDRAAERAQQDFVAKKKQLDSVQSVKSIGLTAAEKLRLSTTLGLPLQVSGVEPSLPGGGPQTRGSPVAPATLRRAGKRDRSPAGRGPEAPRAGPLVSRSAPRPGGSGGRRTWSHSPTYPRVDSAPAAARFRKPNASRTSSFERLGPTPNKSFFSCTIWCGTPLAKKFEASTSCC